MFTKPTKRGRGLAPALFVLSAALTGAGFLIDPVPFFVAYLPFAGVLCVLPCRKGTRLPAFALVAGHFLWTAIIGGWGLVQLGLAPSVVIAGGIAGVILVSTGMAWLGVGLGAIVLTALPFFPANPLLVTGSILPGTGLWGLCILPLWLILIEWQDRAVVRAAMLLVILVLPPMAGGWFDLRATAPGPPAYAEIDITGDRALTERGQWAASLSHIGDGETIVLGENILAHDDHAGVSWWCRQVTARRITALIGVLGPTGLGDVWQFDAKTCPQPVPVYRARLGVPLVNAGWWPQGTRFVHEWNGGVPYKSEWLICFEAFSMWRWIAVGLNRTGDARPVLIIANDRWTEPIPTTSLRRKVARQFAALYARHIHHADSGKTMLRALTEKM